MIQLSRQHGFCFFIFKGRSSDLAKKQAKTAAMKSGDFIADVDFILYFLLYQCFARGAVARESKVGGPKPDPFPHRSEWNIHQHG